MTSLPRASVLAPELREWQSQKHLEVFVQQRTTGRVAARLSDWLPSFVFSTPTPAAPATPLERSTGLHHNGHRAPTFLNEKRCRCCEVLFLPASSSARDCKSCASLVPSKLRQCPTRVPVWSAARSALLFGNATINAATRLRAQKAHSRGAVRGNRT